MLRRQAGDTLVEVLFAVAVFSLVVVGALTIMNQGTNASQRAVDISLVRQEIDAQAESLRFMRDSYIAVYRPGITFPATDTSPAAEWSRMVGRISLSGVSAASPFTNNAATCPAFPGGSFILDARRARAVFTPGILQPAPTYAKTQYADDGAFQGGRGLWVEAVRSAPGAGNSGFIDFHIRACWASAGLAVTSTQGTIVRLYEPR